MTERNTHACLKAATPRQQLILVFFCACVCVCVCV